MTIEEAMKLYGFGASLKRYFDTSLPTLREVPVEEWDRYVFDYQDELYARAELRPVGENDWMPVYYCAGQSYDARKLAEIRDAVEGAPTQP